MACLILLHFLLCTLVRYVDASISVIAAVILIDLSALSAEPIQFQLSRCPARPVLRIPVQDVVVYNVIVGQEVTHVVWRSCGIEQESLISDWGSKPRAERGSCSRGKGVVLCRGVEHRLSQHGPVEDDVDVPMEEPFRERHGHGDEIRILGATMHGEEVPDIGNSEGSFWDKDCISLGATS